MDPKFGYSSSKADLPAERFGFDRMWPQFADMLASTSSINTVFVVGSQRSGTTWMQLLLDNHPNCACRFELRLHDTLMAEVHRMIGVYNALISRHSKHVPAFASAETRMYDQTRMMLMMRAMFFAHFFPLPKPELLYLGEKTPENLFGIDDIDTLFPEARYVVVVRDGRDSALSSWHHFRNNGDVETSLATFLRRWIPEHWAPMVKAASDLHRRRPRRSFVVKYEEMVARPIDCARSVFDFLGLDSSTNILTRCVEATSFTALSGGRHPGDERKDHFFRKGVVGDWRSVFGIDETAVFRELGSETNQLFGYTD